VVLAVAPVELEKVPAGQGLHVVLAIAPVELEKVPAGQELHAVVNWALQEPTAQQTPAPALLFKPAAQGAQEV